MRTRLRGIKRGLRASRDGSLWLEPGHYYSPILSVDDREAFCARRNMSTEQELLGIDLRRNAQMTLFRELKQANDAAPFMDSARRYHLNNNMFAWWDAFTLAGMLRLHRPGRLIEVGSGFSSALALDVIDADGLGTQCTFIEPYPERLQGLLSADDLARHQLIQSPLQEVPVSAFAGLGRNDVLFIDSTHVSRAGSDVNYLFFDILPRLQPGVLIHVHDVQWPFDYPDRWIREGRSWTEAYLLRAFLQYNESFEVVLMTHLMSLIPELGQGLPPFGDAGGSIWLKRRG